MMVEVIWYRQYNRVTATGHALSDTYGRDLICAACSTLMLTLAGNVQRMADADIMTAMTVQLDDGNAEISCNPRPRYRAVVAQMMQSVCVGFEIMAEKYPDYISFTVRG